MFRCKNLRIRQKHYNKYYWCKEFKRVIVLDECKNCSKLNVKRNKPIKKVSKKKNVKKEVYEQVIERDNYTCRLYNKNECQGYLELHHIYYRSERQDLINSVKNCIMLCTFHHEQVHKNKDYWQPRLLKMNKGVKDE